MVDNDRDEAHRLVEQCRRNPDDADLWLHTGLLLDSLGREATAVRHYQHALALGLTKEQQRTALISLASSHRNLREADAALDTLARTRKKFANDPAVEAFYALALLDIGRPRKAIRVLGLALVASARDGALGGFERALQAKFRGVVHRQ